MDFPRTSREAAMSGVAQRRVSSLRGVFPPGGDRWRPVNLRETCPAKSILSCDSRTRVRAKPEHCPPGPPPEVEHLNYAVFAERAGVTDIHVGTKKCRQSDRGRRCRPRKRFSRYRRFPDLGGESRRTRFDGLGR